MYYKFEITTKYGLQEGDGRYLTQERRSRFPPEVSGVS